jgi:hypothetical protein
VADLEGDANSSSSSSSLLRFWRVDLFDNDVAVGDRGGRRALLDDDDDNGPPLLLLPRDGGSGPRSISSTTTVPPTVVSEFILSSYLSQATQIAAGCRITLLASTDGLTPLNLNVADFGKALRIET